MGKMMLKDTAISQNRTPSTLEAKRGLSTKGIYNDAFYPA